MGPGGIAGECEVPRSRRSRSSSAWPCNLQRRHSDVRAEVFTRASRAPSRGASEFDSWCAVRRAVANTWTALVVCLARTPGVSEVESLEPLECRDGGSEGASSAGGRMGPLSAGPGRSSCSGGCSRTGASSEVEGEVEWDAMARVRFAVCRDRR
jgi:hypothetical protein